jgi:hypothetical protein
MGSELDLNNFAGFTVEDPVSQIIEGLFEDKVLCNRFGLKGTVRFENHSNTLSLDRAAEEVQSLNISNNQRRSEHLRSNVSNPDQVASSKSAKSAPTIKSSRPRADQFCVYNIDYPRGRINPLKTGRFADGERGNPFYIITHGSSSLSILDIAGCSLLPQSFPQGPQCQWLSPQQHEQQSGESRLVSKTPLQIVGSLRQVTLYRCRLL